MSALTEGDREGLVSDGWLRDSVSCLVIDSGAIAVLDAGHALGQLTGEQAMALAVAAANTRPLMRGVGGAAPVVGDNPLVGGVLMPEGPSAVLDMALSEEAPGKIRLAALPEGAIPE
ncbi:hypothetical protein [Microtetraspora malaysiensis]|uniref:hypothetical protein n=1 Tax=Microtetraspora malaysiensis TaxID=161358 RepID=UPI003D90943F